MSSKSLWFMPMMSLFKNVVFHPHHDGDELLKQGNDDSPIATSDAYAGEEHRKMIRKTSRETKKQRSIQYDAC